MYSHTLDLRAIVDDKQSEDRPETRPSTTFKSIGREKIAHWSNRFRKDFNDLQYDVKYNLIKGKNDLKKSPKNQKNLKSSRLSKSSRSSEAKVSGISIQKYKNRVEMIKMNKMSNPEKFSISEERKYSTLHSQGLCKHEYEKTIVGKMAHKTNNHLQFQHQTQRSVNLNSVWYDPLNQVDTQKALKKKDKKDSHPFSSYTVRKVFVPREQLDKFYNTSKSFNLATARTIRQTCKISGLVGRRPQKPPISATLSYNQYEAKKKIMEKICSYPINKIKRELQFSRQVISPERGCYR